MSNLIDKQVAIDALREAENHAFNSYYQGLIKAHRIIADLPPAQPEQKWIPCSERFPDKKESNYWVCTDSGNQCQCRWTNNRYGLGANEWSEWGWHVMDKPQYERVVAWMPLPEPYKEGGVSKND